MLQYKKKLIIVSSVLLLIIFLNVKLSTFGSLASTSIIGNSYKEINGIKPTLAAIPDWSTTYGINATDEGYNVAVDSLNNVYVVGFVDNGTGNTDICLIKYNSSGEQQWNRIWGDNNTDKGYGISIDSNDNIYVTGYSDNGTGNWDIVLLKYNSSGDLELETEWGGKYRDAGYSLAMDSSNNIYITGFISRDNDIEDILLLKYNSSGIFEWNVTWGYRWPQDIGYDIAIDSNNNSYIVGYTEYYGTAVFDDIILIKCNSSGDEQWYQTWGQDDYDEGRGIIIDSSDEVYITGVTESYGAEGFDILIAKYDEWGMLLWTRRWGEANNERGYDIILDSIENLYITGYSDSFGADNEIVLLYFDNMGMQLENMSWGGIYDDVGYGLALDSQNNTYITGFTSSYGAGYRDICLIKNMSVEIKVNPTTQNWFKTWGGENWDDGTSIAVDLLGNIYVVGSTKSYGAGEFNISLVQYNSTGDQQWNRTWGGIYNDRAYCVTVDSAGYIYVTGYHSEDFSPDYRDIVLLKYNSSGGLVWNKTWGVSGQDIGYDIIIDSNNSIYVVGHTQYCGSGDINIVLLKFNSSGYQQWNDTWSGYDVGSNDDIDVGYGIALDLDNDIYVVGYTESTCSGKSDIIMLEYDSMGVRSPPVFFGGIDIDVGRSVAVDSITGDIYVSGYTRSYGSGNDDLLLIKYDRTFTQQWYKTWGNDSIDRGYDVALNASGDIYVLGITYSYGAGLSDMCLVRFNSTGAEVWHGLWGGDNNDFGESIFINSSDSIYLAGYTSSYGEECVDMVLIKNLKDQEEEELGVPDALILAIIIISIVAVGATITIIWILKRRGKLF